VATPTLNLDQIGFETRGLDSGRELSGVISARARIEESGTMAAEGRASLAPRSSPSTSGLSVPLRPVQAYLDTFIRLDIVAATRISPEARGRSHEGRSVHLLAARRWPRPRSGGGRFGFRGTSSVWRMRSESAELDLGPDRFRLHSLSIARLRRRLRSAPSLAQPLPHLPGARAAPKGTEVKAVPFTIDKIAFGGGTHALRGSHGPAPYVTRIDGIAGELANLSSDPKAEAHIQLAGKADGTAPIKVDARLRPATRSPTAFSPSRSPATR
jgi:hypothetical protein